MYKIHINHIPKNRLASLVKTRTTRSKINYSESSENTFDNENISYKQSRHSTEQWAKREKTLSGYFLQKNIKKIPTNTVVSVVDEIPPQVHILQTDENKTYLLAKQNSNNLTVDDFNELNDKRMISNPLIEYFLESVCENEIMYLNGYITRVIFGSKVINVLRQITFNKNECILPIHSGKLTDGHWTLAIINKKEKTFMYLDSGAAKTRREKISQNFFEKFGQFLDVFNTFDKSLGLFKHWKLKNDCNYPKQKDTYNCGIFLLKFAELYIKNGAIELPSFNPLQYRHYLKKYVLDKSDDLNTISTCRICYRKESSNTETWVQCYLPTCQRWYHCKCLKLDYYTLTQEGIIFKCSMCM